MGKNVSKKIIFDNCLCLSKEGERMFYCNLKKAHNYLKKGIAEMVSEDPFVFKILFEPNGKGVPNQRPRTNECVVCGSDCELTQHHIIPKAFRKLMDRKYKDHRSEDLAVLCEHHHHEYEISSRKMQFELLCSCVEEIMEQNAIKRAKKSFDKLMWNYDSLPEEKIKELEGHLSYLHLKKRSDFEILLEKYGTEKIITLWKDDFVSWIKKKKWQTVRIQTVIKREPMV